MSLRCLRHAAPPPGPPSPSLHRRDHATPRLPESQSARPRRPAAAAGTSTPAFMTPVSSQSALAVLLLPLGHPDIPAAPASRTPRRLPARPRRPAAAAGTSRHPCGACITPRRLPVRTRRPCITGLTSRHLPVRPRRPAAAAGTPTPAFITHVASQSASSSNPADFEPLRRR